MWSFRAAWTNSISVAGDDAKKEDEAESKTKKNKKKKAKKKEENTDSANIESATGSSEVREGGGRHTTVWARDVGRGGRERAYPSWPRLTDGGCGVACSSCFCLPVCQLPETKAPTDVASILKAKAKKKKSGGAEPEKVSVAAKEAKQRAAAIKKAGKKNKSHYNEMPR